MDRWIHNVVTNNIRKGKIAESDAEIYEYGYTLMVEKIMIFVISVAIALLLDAVWEVLALLCSVTYTFHFKVMKYYLSRKSADVERCNDSLDVLTTLFTELSREVEKCKKKWD